MIRVRLLALLTGAILLLSGVPAVASEEHPGYLALGDSVAFGFDPLVSDADRADPENFEGYPEALAGEVDLQVVNASCPGEASGGFISLSGLDNSCRPYRAFFPLHVPYATSQLDFAVAFLKAHPRTQLVTLNIGANDLFVLVRECTDEDGVLDAVCFGKGFPELLKTLGQNLAAIYKRIRVEAGYRGQLVALTYYLTDYRDAFAAQVIGAINGVVAGVTEAFKGRVADGFGAFQAAAASSNGDSCAAGLLIRLSDTMCDIHPSSDGRETLAKAIRAVVIVGDDTD